MATETFSLNGWVTARTVRLEIRRDSDGQYLDHDDLTFKAAGWVTRQLAMSEVGTAPGILYRATVNLGEAAFVDGTLYQAIITDAAVTTRALAGRHFTVKGGRLVVDDGVAAAVWREPITDHDQETLAGTRAATRLMNVVRRFFNKVTQSATTQTVYKSDAATALATATVSDDGTVQTKGAAS